MPTQQPNNDMLTRYLLQEVNAEEAAFITAWLASHSSNQQYFLAFEKVWLLSRFSNSSETINVDAEWDAFKQHIAESNAENSTVSQPATYPLYEQPAVSKRNNLRFIITAIAVAASIAAVVFIGKFLFVNHTTESPAIVVAAKPKDSVALVLRHEVNTTGNPKKLLLQDGTVIILEDKSEVSFAEPFAANKRSITLQGKANFKVAKDKTRPFTVYSDAVATTVLGTVFDVSAYPKSGTITVRLYEGKVVVNAATASSKKLKKPIYLSPGYEMLYNKQNALASVRQFSSGKPVLPSTNNTAPSNIDNPAIPKKKGSWFMFNNQPLSQVFNQLQEMYKVNIQYSKKDVQKLYFIGEFNREDSIETILEQIARSNNLTLTNSSDTFFIKK